MVRESMQIFCRWSLSKGQCATLARKSSNTPTMAVRAAVSVHTVISRESNCLETIHNNRVRIYFKVVPSNTIAL